MWIKDGTKLRKQYTGDWIEGLRHGLGIYYYKNGNKYEGQWRRGQRHGRGKLVYANGDVYEGDWLEGKRSGLGVLSYSNGDRFEGHWHLDKKEGPGRYLYYNTSKMYEGEWADDIAKCGVYSDITPEMFGSGISKADFLAARTADAFDLPALHLADAEKTVGDAMAAVRKRRAAERGQRALEVSEGVFTVDEIRQLREAFRVVDVCNEGTIPGHGLVNVLEALGMQPNEEDVEALLAELGAESSGSVSFAEFAGVLARLKV